MLFQKTINKKIYIDGVGVHTGQKTSVTLHPAEENSGIVFQDSKNPDNKIKVGEVLPKDSSFSTIIQKDYFVVSTIEHLMAAINGLGIDNLIIEVYGNEISIMDGSALPFAQAILDSKIRTQNEPKKLLTPNSTLVFKEEDKLIEIIPHAIQKNNSFESPHSTNSGQASTHSQSSLAPSLRQKASAGAQSERFISSSVGMANLSFTYSIDFPHPLVKNKKLEIDLNEESFVKEIAPARTFGFLNQLPMLRKHGLAQGTNLGNTVVIGEYNYLNTLRFPDEFVRHKLLDLIGDLSLLGYQIAGQITAHKTGHSFNRKVIEHYLNNKDKWKLIS